MNTKTLTAIALLSLTGCGAQVATDQPPSEAGADVAASKPLQDAGAGTLVVDGTSTDDASADTTEQSKGADAVTTTACQGPNRVGCAGLPDACQPGFFCDTDPAHGCAPSMCACSPPQGWACSADCGGGVCRAVGDAGDSGVEAATVDAAIATRCCHIGVLYISCSSCTRCDDAGAPLPGDPNWCAYFPGVCCPPGRLDLCGPCPLPLDADAPTDAADASDEASRCCAVGTPTCRPCGGIQ